MTLLPRTITTFAGLGVVGDASGSTIFLQDRSELHFTQRSQAGSAQISNDSEILRFHDSSGAAHAQIDSNGDLTFADNSTAGFATITNSTTLHFEGQSSAGNANIVNGSANRIAVINFFNNTSAANANIVNFSQLEFRDSSTAADATITTGFGARTLFRDSANGQNVKLIINPGGIVDFTGLTSGGTTVGTITGCASGPTAAPCIIGGKTIMVQGVEPGYSIGALIVDGNLTFGSSAVYFVEFAEAGDQTKVTGIAKLDGSVSLDFLPKGAYLKQYNILHADGGFGGTVFGNVIAAPNFIATLSYSPTDVFLDVTPALGLGSALPGNASNVANSINGFFINNGTLPATFVGLYDVTGSNLANTLTQLSGEAATGAQKVGFQLTDQFLNLMLDPFVDGRSGVGGTDHPALGFAPERDTMPPDIAHAYAAVLKAPPKAVPVYEPRWTVWGGACGGGNKTTGDLANIGSHDLSATTAGFAGGFDYHLSRDSVVGLAFAGGGTNWSLAQGLGSGKSDAFQAGVYGATKYGPAYLAAAFAFTNHWMSTDRLAFGDHLTANFNAQSYGGRLEGGYRFGTPYGGITPYAAIQAQSFHTPGYTEAGLIPNGFALAFNGRDATDTRSELGARFDRALALYPNAVLALRGRLAWAHDWVSDPTLTPLFQTLPGASFLVNGATPAKNSALTSAGAELRLANGIALLAKFDGEFASHSSTYAGTGIVRYTW